jgi:hypothetical protein
MYLIDTRSLPSQNGYGCLSNTIARSTQSSFEPPGTRSLKYSASMNANWRLYRRLGKPYTTVLTSTDSWLTATGKKACTTDFERCSILLRPHIVDDIDLYPVLYFNALGLRMTGGYEPIEWNRFYLSSVVQC